MLPQNAETTAVNRIKIESANLHEFQACPRGSTQSQSDYHLDLALAFVNRHFLSSID